MSPADDEYLNFDDEDAARTYAAMENQSYFGHQDAGERTQSYNEPQRLGGTVLGFEQKVVLRSLT